VPDEHKEQIMKNSNPSGLPKNSPLSQGIFKSMRESIPLKAPSYTIFFFIMHLFLIYPSLMPSLQDLGPFDEMIYINGGRLLAQGELPLFSYNPLVTLLYAITYFPYQASPFWIVYSATLGRLVLFSLCWLTMYLIARELSEYAPPLIVAGLLLVSPLLTDLLHNPSDALFAGISGIALWQYLRFSRSKNIRYLWLTSLFLGLASLSRSDGLVLFPIVLFLSLLSTFKENRSIRELGRTALASAVPFALLVGGYVFLYGAVTGNFDTGTASRSYLAFEQGQPLIYTPEAGNLTIEAQFQARELYGTPEENDYSILKAIQRNPQAYLERVKHTLKGLPSLLLRAYHIRLGALIFIFAGYGIYKLIQKKDLALALVLLLWPFHLLVYFLTFFRSGYLLMPFFVMFGLASIGIYSVVQSFNAPRAKLIFSLTLMAFILYGIIDEKLAISAGASVFLLGMLINWEVMSRVRDRNYALTIGLLLALSLGLIIRGPYPSPGFRSLGDNSDEKAVAFMIENLEPGSKVVSFAPGHVLAAKMAYLRFPESLRQAETSDELYQWLIDNDVKAILSVHLLRTLEPQIWEFVEDQIDVNLERVFRADPGDIQVILVQEPD
jgi:hypothetical protein